MLYYCIYIANTILIVTSSLFGLLGWRDKLRPAMAVGCIIVAAIEAYFLARRNYVLAKCTKKEKKWNITNVAFWLILDIIASLYYSGIWR